MTALLEARGLHIESSLGGVRRTIVSEIEIEVAAGETIGIVGESGSGKSLTAKALLGLLPPGVTASGSVTFGGEELLGRSERVMRRYRGRHLSLLFQDPYTLLNPVMRVGRQITETLSEKRGEAERRLAEVGIDDPLVARKYPFELSGGMRQRVGIAAALASNPEILIADEPSTALDVTTQKEILKLLRSIQEQRNMALVLITHDLRVAFSMCDRIYVLYAGSVLEVAPAAELEQTPLHPYSLALLLAEPPLDRRLAALTSVHGSVPPPDEVASSCAFAPRCDFAASVCTAASPPLVEVGRGRFSACVRIEQIRAELATARAVAAEAAAPVVAPARPGEVPVVHVDRVWKSFGPVTALRDVSIEVYPGESVGLVGESGSGKSTLARCLLGLERADRGTITIGGLDATSYRAMRDTGRRAVRGTIQMIFQDPYSSLNPTLSVGATLSEALAVSKSGESVAELLDRVNLPASYAARKPAALSGGERQRVAIARALAVQPRVIVCDEPVSALDVSVQAQVLTLFRKICDELGIGYLFITHDLAVVRQVVDRVYVLHRGVVVEQGEVSTVLEDAKDDYTRRLVASVPRNEPDWLTT